MEFVLLEKIGNVELTFNISKALVFVSSVSMSILEMGVLLGKSMLIISSTL